MIADGRRVEVAQHQARIVAERTHETCFSAHIDQEPFHRPGNRIERQAAAPTANLRKSPIELGGRHVAGIELMNQQRIDVFLLDGPLRGVRTMPKDGRNAIDAELGRAHIDVMELDPFSRNPALEAEHAKLCVAAEVMDEAREQQRDERFPTRVVALQERFFEDRLIGCFVALRKIERRLPDALRKLRAAIGIFHVLLGELAAIGAERSIKEEKRLHTCWFERPARLAQRVECAQYRLLAADDILRRQAAKPCRHRLDRCKRIGNFPGPRRQKTKHADARSRLIESVAVKFVRYNSSCTAMSNF